MRSDVCAFGFRGVAVVLLAGGILPAAALGQLVPPVPLTQPQAEPTNRSGMPAEGWAIVRYWVLADGSTDNVRVIDRMPAQLPEREIRDAADSWTFEPATSNGSPITWHNNESVMVFDVEAVPPEPSAMFVQGYREVEALLAAGDTADALRRSRRLLTTETSRLAEIGVGLVQSARVDLALGDSHAAYAAIRRATDPRLSLLEPSELRVALEYRNTLELRLGDVVGALATLARRRTLGPVPETDLMASNAGTIETALAGDAAIVVAGKILDETWMHDLARRTFAIGDLVGDLREIDVECDRNTAVLEYSVESEWSLPESWGDCTVTVSGRRDTEFALYEFR